jgi:hypothetical protein
MRRLASNRRLIWFFITSFLTLLYVGCGRKAQPPIASEPSAKTTAEESSNAIAASKPSEDKLAAIDESLDVIALLEMRPPQDELDQGWVRLFDGQSLFGWENAGNANWRVEEGAITADQGETGLLCTTSRFADYELKVEFQSETTTNSGVFLRTPPKPTAPDKDCFELNIAPPDNPFPTGSLVARARVEPKELESFDASEWHEFHALLDRDRIQIWVDGKPVVDYKDTTGRQSGRIGLQFREGKVSFRNIRIRPLLYEKILPSQDLSKWSLSDSPAKFELNSEGALQIEGGKGQIELRQAYSDFVLQAKVKTLAQGVNSGIFFRCIPGDEMNGYECQIQNEWVEDQRRPKDFGTGAIFRRQPARAVLAEDLEWAHLTIVADGPHISTWVSGIHVVDWLDTRQPNDNPRLGLRTEAGSVILQAHDPACKLLIGELSVASIPSDTPSGP